MLITLRFLEKTFIIIIDDDDAHLVDAEVG